MRIAYFDLNYPDMVESYSSNPRRYGGGRVLAAPFKNLEANNRDEFLLFSTPDSFAEINARCENIYNCRPITYEEKDKLRKGVLAESLFPELAAMDIVVHHFTQFYINTKLPQVVWAVGYNDAVHPKHEHLILYNDFQHPILYGSPKIYKAKIGITVDYAAGENDAHSFIFQCSRHNDAFGSSLVREYCESRKLRGVFAGPIDKDFSFPTDNQNTFYMGQISETRKLELYRGCRFGTFLHSWPTPFNLSAIQCLGSGRPIVCSDTGFWRSLAKDGANAFVIPNSLTQKEKFIQLDYAWANAHTISSDACKESVKEYTTENMIKEFYAAFEKVLHG